MNMMEMITRLRGLGHMVARQASEREDLDIEGKSYEAARLFLEVIDGKTPYFPKCVLNASPHPDDIHEAQEDGSAWHDPDTKLQDGLSTLFAESMSRTDWSFDERDGDAYSSEETTRLFLRAMASCAEYWGKVNPARGDIEHGSDHDACVGTVFSILTVIDGSSLAAPMFDIVPDIEDISARPGLSGFEPIVLDGYLHDGFCQTAEFKPEENLTGPSI